MVSEDPFVVYGIIDQMVLTYVRCVPSALMATTKELRNQDIFLMKVFSLLRIDIVLFQSTI